MNCDEFLTALETGGPWQRKQARRHADRCPKCRPVYDAWQSAKLSLASPAPLSPHARELWQRALRDGVTQSGRQIRLAPLVACLATAACVLLVFVGPGLWRPRDRFGPFIPGSLNETTFISPTSVISLDPREEFTDLAEAVGALEAELESVRLIAERREAQREVLVALNRYGRW